MPIQNDENQGKSQCQMSKIPKLDIWDLGILKHFKNIVDDATSIYVQPRDAAMPTAMLCNVLKIF